MTNNTSFLLLALSLCFILFLPGYGVTDILFARRDLDFPARLLLSVGLSLAISALIGLILHLTPLGLTLRNPWLFLLLGEVCILGLLFLLRDILNLNAAIVVRVGFNSRQLLLLVLAGMIATTAVGISLTPVSPKNLTGYTLFWVSPDSRTGRLTIGAQSEEFQKTKYQVRYEVNQVLQDGPMFELQPGETWKDSINLDSKGLAGQPVTFLLYRLDNPDQVYRRVVWWYENN